MKEWMYHHHHHLMLSSLQLLILTRSCNKKTRITTGLSNFFAPWCGHCKHLAPIYEQVATTLKTSSTDKHVAKVDCTKHKDLCSRFGVQGYPTVKFIHVPKVNDENSENNNKDTRRVYEYDQARTLDGFIKYANGVWSQGSSVRFPLKGETSSSSSSSNYFMSFIVDHPAYGVIGILVILGLTVGCIVMVVDSVKDDSEEIPINEQKKDMGQVNTPSSSSPSHSQNTSSHTGSAEEKKPKSSSKGKKQT